MVPARLERSRRVVYPGPMLKDIALAIPAIRRLHHSRNRLIEERDALARRVAALEQAGDGAGSVFFHYHACFDAIGTIQRHALPDPEPDPEHLTNFLGVRIEPAFFPRVLDGRAGNVEPPPRSPPTGMPTSPNGRRDYGRWTSPATDSP